MSLMSLRPLKQTLSMIRLDIYVDIFDLANLALLLSQHPVSLSLIQFLKNKNHYSSLLFCCCEIKKNKKSMFVVILD